MQVVTIESEAFQQIVEKIEAINERLTAKEKQPKDIWYDNDELTELLHVSKRTLQNYRDNGTISFSQLGNKIFYKASDVEALLAKHYVKAHNPKK